MFLKPLKFWQKIALIAVESVMAVAGLAVIGSGLVLWQLNKGPIEVGFARKYIESELSDPDHNLSMLVDQVYLEWSAIDSRPQVSLKKARMVNTRTEQTLIAVDSLGVTLSRKALVLGQVRPRTIVIRRPLLTVVRKEDGSFNLALEQKNQQVQEKPATPLSAQSEFLFGILDTLTKPDKDIPRDWPVRSLRMIVIEGAQVMVEDHILQRSWMIPRADIGMRRAPGSLVSSASLWLDDSAADGPPTVVSEVAYLGQSKNIVANMSLNNLSAPFLASRFPDLDWLRNQNVVLTGKAQATLGAGFVLSGLEATLESSGGEMLIPDLYERPIPYKKLLLNLAYDGTSRVMTLKDSPLTMADDFSMTVSAKAVPGEVEKSYKLPLRILIHSLPQARLAEFWPTLLDEPEAEEWALKRLSEGRIYDSTIDIDLSAAHAEEEWSVKLDNLKAAFSLENMTVDYSPPLMPVTKGNAQGTYDLSTDRLDIDVASGQLGDLDIQSGKIRIDTVIGKAVGKATIDAHLKGPVKTVFKYISSKPINVASNIVSDQNKIEGTADLKVNVAFPTLAVLPAEKIKVGAEGVAENVLLPGLVHGLDVAGGPVKVTVKDERVDASGKGRIDGRDMNFTYAQYFEAKNHPFGMQVKADLMVDTGLRTKFGIELSDWMEGSVPAKITYTDFGGHRAEIDVDVDATPATLMVKPMNYTKSPGQAASASAKVFLQNNILTAIKGLSVVTPDGKAEGGEMGFTQSGKETLLTSGKFARARLYETDVAISYDISLKNAIRMNIQGNFLDARPFLENNKKEEDYQGPSLAAKVQVDRMRTAEARLVEKARISIDMDTQGELNLLEMDAMAGRGAMTFRYRPEGDRMTLMISAEDAGAALQAFDVYPNTRGGKLLIQGSSIPGGDRKVIVGKAELTDFRVINAPVLARLVNALSLPGILSLLGSDGIDFSRLQAAFSWEKRKRVDIITVRDGKTSGASMGLTFEGVLDRHADTIDVNGTIVPASMINDIISNIPIVGDILTAGSGDAVFAATYTLKGPSKNPTTMVNPLAVLAPGFLRQIFFE